jgi:hypothetical protein
MAGRIFLNLLAVWLVSDLPVLTAQLVGSTAIFMTAALFEVINV